MPTPDTWYSGSAGAVKWRSHRDREREEHLTGSFQEKHAGERRGTYWGIYGTRNKETVGTTSSK
ncbi:hypothetical protein APTSU1_000657200 [Apodemus speciosus]|uniref:Uncharacterized protein n=1 Tax=Apodemus speciosus TaxID=105296 RepID=A0ABQ0EWB8_APOSI